MTKKIKPAIDYTNKEFSTIKRDLVEYAKRYYPERFRDFSVNSFGSLMLDTVAYVGDMLSFYLDYQVNESNLSTALEYNNVLKLARQTGYSPELSPASYGMITCFVLIPSTNGAPNFDYAPTLKSGTRFKTGIGEIFTLLEDINFKNETENEIVVGDVDRNTGTPLTYAIRARGQAVSGELAIARISVGEYSRFRKIDVPGENITEIVSVSDSEGNFFYEVDYLTQNVIYLSFTNQGDDKKTVNNILKPVAVPRRYVVSKERSRYQLQFGFGTGETAETLLDPSNVFLEQHGKEYITDNSFDPSTLLKTDSLGVCPSNTTMTIVYRINTTQNTNAAANSITKVVDPIYDFSAENTLNATLVKNVRDSLEVVNEEAFVGSVPLPTAEEIRMRALGNFSMQNRMVTRGDFVAAAYNLPAKFGKLKRVAVHQDSDSFNQRNINMYVISEDSSGFLTKANGTIKNNLKTYLSRYKMINDSIDILDATIINLKINFKISAAPDVNKFNALDIAKEAIVSYFAERAYYDIGEPFSITDIFAVLKNTASVLDVIEVDIETRMGDEYADTNFSTIASKSSDNTKIVCPVNSIFEIKYPNSDIIGTVV
tara:strand:+ start:1431 stop:3227 length:1797 start_codon:yes stop_codon:yes gene_type:complete